MSDCPHDKVYADHILASNPPQKEWICRTCGEHGTDTIGEYVGPSDYDKLTDFWQKKQP